MLIAPLKNAHWGAERNRLGISRPATIAAALLLLSVVFLISLVVLVVEFI